FTSIGAWWNGALTSVGFVRNSLWDWTNFQILAFVALVMAMIAVLLVSGGLQGIVRAISKYASSAQSTQATTAAMGLAVFIDDYANTMMVGTSMRPLSDRYRVSREK